MAQVFVTPSFPHDLSRRYRGVPTAYQSPVMAVTFYRAIKL